MSPLDVVVGVVAIGLGILLFVTGAANSDNLERHSKLRRLTAVIGRTAARFVCVVLGVAFIALGVAVALGWKMLWS